MSPVAVSPFLPQVHPHSLVTCPPSQQPLQLERNARNSAGLATSCATSATWKDSSSFGPWQQEEWWQTAQESYAEREQKHANTSYRWQMATAEIHMHARRPQTCSKRWNWNSIYSTTVLGMIHNVSDFALGCFGCFWQISKIRNVRWVANAWIREWTV